MIKELTELQQKVKDLLIKVEGQTPEEANYNLRGTNEETLKVWLKEISERGVRDPIMKHSINLPPQYKVVTVYNRQKDREEGDGIYCENSDSNCLLLFKEDHLYQYTRDEVKELFVLRDLKGDIIPLDI